MPKQEQLGHDEAGEEASEIQQNLKEIYEPLEEGGFDKEQYQKEAEELWKTKELEKKSLKWAAREFLREYIPESDIELEDSVLEKSIKGNIFEYLCINHIDDAVRLKNHYHILKEEIQIIGRQAITSCIISGINENSDYVYKIKEKFNVSDKFFQEAVNTGTYACIKQGSFDHAIRIKDKFKELIEVKEDDMKSALTKGISDMCRLNREIDTYELKPSLNAEINGVKKAFNISEKKVLECVQNSMLVCLSSGEYKAALHIRHIFNPPEKFITSVAVHEAAKKGFISSFLSDEADGIGNAMSIHDGFNLPALDTFKDVNEELNYYYEALDPYQKSLADVFQLASLRSLRSFFENKEFKEFVDFIRRTPDKPLTIEKQDLPEIKKFGITLLEAEKIKREDDFPTKLGEKKISWREAGKSFKDISAKSDFDGLFERLKFMEDENSNWKDQQNIVKPFEEGQKVFGAEKMFAYLNRPGLSRHAGLHAFKDIVGLFEDSDLSPEQFYNNILAQVNKDDSTYEAGTAHHQLNELAEILDVDIGEILEKAKNYQDITRLQELVEVLNSPQAVFGSWKNLKRFDELANILNRTEILDGLKDLKSEGKDKLYQYIETLAFHPSSKVNMQKVFEFWRDPESFLDEGDEHTPYEVHNRKKPSNYIEIPNLDLNAEELRDALVEGKMDGLQAFTPMEIEYRIPTGEVYPLPLRDKLKTALGSFKDKVKGEARDPKKLFSELKNLFKKYKLNFQEYLEGDDLPQEKGIEIEKEIIDLVNNEKIGLAQEENHEQIFVAKINRKSDPEGVLAGNDTSCCMPFGSGKNTVYTFNPDTSLFTLQIKRPDGTLRTIAQSVLTKDKDVKTLVPDILEKMEEVGEKIDGLLPEEVLNKSFSYLACDNVEVAPNFQTPEYAKTIEQIYRDFFTEYMKRFAKGQGLVSDEVIIGQGYSDSLDHLPTKPNTFVPLAPVGYSDKTEDEVYTLDLTKSKQKLKRKITASEVAESPQTKLLDIKGLSYLTFQDTLAVAYLEGKAYSDNESLMEYLHNVENCLIAKDINNAAKGRQNMSLKYIDSEGRMRSYITAYEGEFGAGYQEDYDEEETENEELLGERIIYIEDFASDRKSPLAAGSLLKGFAELYKRNYLEKGDLVPIYAQAREQTSYVLIQRNLKNIAESIGVDFELEELEPYEEGPDIMHPVIIRPKKTA